MTPLRAIVVDDEPLAREGLAAELCALGVDVVAACDNGFAAIEAIHCCRPDALLLDIAMPELDGFAMLERLEPEDVPPALIFVTAFDAHAVRAFDARALDYLLKPVHPERLRDAVVRAEQRVAEASAHRAALAAEAGDVPPPDDATDRGRYLRQLLVRERGRTIVVRVDDLEWIEADAYYAQLHTDDGARPRLLRERMSILESRLDPTAFFRTHRSAIVRLARIRSIRSVTRYEHAVLLASGDEAPLSRERRPRLESLLTRKIPLA